MVNDMLQDPEVFFSRKKRYAIQAQVVCTADTQIRFFCSGFPGSVHDSSQFSTSRLWKDRMTLFSGREYLLADSGYALTPFTITPYPKPQTTRNQRNREFNIRFSSLRVRVEHTIGIIKARFPSIDRFVMRLNSKDDFVRLNDWITSAFTLHNFLLRVKDGWEPGPNDIVGPNGNDEELDAEGPVQVMDGAGRILNDELEGGREKREQLKDYILWAEDL